MIVMRGIQRETVLYMQFYEQAKDSATLLGQAAFPMRLMNVGSYLRAPLMVMREQGCILSQDPRFVVDLEWRDNDREQPFLGEPEEFIQEEYDIAVAQAEGRGERPWRPPAPGEWRPTFPVQPRLPADCCRIALAAVRRMLEKRPDCVTLLADPFFIRTCVDLGANGRYQGSAVAQAGSVISFLEQTPTNYTKPEDWRCVGGIWRPPAEMVDPRSCHAWYADNPKVFDDAHVDTTPRVGTEASAEEFRTALRSTASPFWLQGEMEHYQTGSAPQRTGGGISLGLQASEFVDPSPAVESGTLPGALPPLSPSVLGEGAGVGGESRLPVRETLHDGASPLANAERGDVEDAAQESEGSSRELESNSSESETT